MDVPTTSASLPTPEALSTATDKRKEAARQFAYVDFAVIHDSRPMFQFTVSPFQNVVKASPVDVQLPPNHAGDSARIVLGALRGCQKNAARFSQRPRHHPHRVRQAGQREEYHQAQLRATF